MATKIITPKGEIKWVFINGNPKKDLNGKDRYTASLILKKDSPEHKEIEAAIAKFWEDNKPKNKAMKSNGIKPEKLDGNNTGNVSINFWTGITWPDGTDKVVKIYNAKNNEVSLGNKKIGNGSIGRISGVMDVYESGPNAGVTLYLNAIQLTRFVEYGGDDFAGCEDDGWAGDEDLEFGESTNGEEVPKVRL